MTSLDPTAHSIPAARILAPRLALVLFAATLFLSALLLFSVQPMFTKMVLPRLGGAPSVWSGALVFFPAMLLAGFLYAAQPHPPWFRPPPHRGRRALADRPVRGLRGLAVLCRIRQRAAAASLVRQKWASASERPVFSLWRLESRFLPGAHRLPAPHGAHPHLARAILGLDGGL